MNILLVTNLLQGNKYEGVESYRMIEPSFALNKYIGGYDFSLVPRHEWDLDNQFSKSDLPFEERIEFLKEQVKGKDLVIFNRDVFPSALKFLQENNIKYALDLDDYWVLPGHHPLHKAYNEINYIDVTLNSLRFAEFITVTNENLAEKVKEYNQNVYIIENGIDFKNPIWKPNKIESNRLRFGFTQGSTHLEDMKSLFVYIRRCLTDYEFKVGGQIVYCGFAVPEKDDVESYTWRKLNVSQYIEAEMTNGHKLLEYKHARYLRAYEPFNDLNHPYRRINALPVTEFPSVYDSMDVSVAILKDNTFNSCKSNIKMLEAAAKDCAIMCTTKAPYSLANTKNSFSLYEKTFREWTKILIKNPNLVADSKAQLRQDVECYSLENLSKKRDELYKRYKKG